MVVGLMVLGSAGTNFSSISVSEVGLCVVGSSGFEALFQFWLYMAGVLIDFQILIWFCQLKLCQCLSRYGIVSFCLPPSCSMCLKLKMKSF
ncbi:hypothetical protein AXX17_AT2G08680 [Arabidopsis thaliana]|uniref:Transmembrane protein n=1 Tax=Arabidopsis thaliana TaxID=3702 RepID=A0A178VS22_ARATH|nr:hypothetical protein AXX17_AT2G08680 [Arabidopsis thaliana]